MRCPICNAWQFYFRILFIKLVYKSNRLPEIEDDDNNRKLSDFNIKDGSIIHLGCYDWSNEITKKNGWTDKLTIALGSKKFREWQKNKAYK